MFSLLAGLLLKLAGVSQHSLCYPHLHDLICVPASGEDVNAIIATAAHKDFVETSAQTMHFLTTGKNPPLTDVKVKFSQELPCVAHFEVFHL